jgi:hypothetical protein
MEHATEVKAVDRVLFAGQFVGHSRWRFDSFRALRVECCYLDQRSYFDETSWRRPLERVEFTLGYVFQTEVQLFMLLGVVYWVLRISATFVPGVVGRSPARHA